MIPFVKCVFQLPTFILVPLILISICYFMIGMCIFSLLNPIVYICSHLSSSEIIIVTGLYGDLEAFVIAAAAVVLVANVAVSFGNKIIQF